MKWTAVACASNYFTSERDLCIIVFYFSSPLPSSLPTEIFIHYRPFLSFMQSEYFISRKNVVNTFNICYAVVVVSIYSFLSLSLFLINNLNNRINEC